MHKKGCHTQERIWLYKKLINTEDIIGNSVGHLLDRAWYKVIVNIIRHMKSLKNL